MSYYTYILAKYDISDCKTFEDVKSKFPDARPAFLRKVIYLKGLRITKDGRLTKGTPIELNLMHRGLLDHHKLKEDYDIAELRNLQKIPAQAELEKRVRMSRKQKAFVHIASTPCACCEHLVHRNERYSCIRNRVIPEYVSSVWATKCVAFKQKKPVVSDKWNIVPQFRTSLPTETVAFNKYKLDAVPVEHPDDQGKEYVKPENQRNNRDMILFSALGPCNKNQYCEWIRKEENAHIVYLVKNNLTHGTKCLIIISGSPAVGKSCSLYFISDYVSRKYRLLWIPLTVHRLGGCSQIHGHLVHFLTVRDFYSILRRFSKDVSRFVNYREALRELLPEERSGYIKSEIYRAFDKILCYPEDYEINPFSLYNAVRTIQPYLDALMINVFCYMGKFEGILITIDDLEHYWRVWAPSQRIRFWKCITSLVSTIKLPAVLCMTGDDKSSGDIKYLTTYYDETFRIIETVHFRDLSSSDIWAVCQRYLDGIPAETKELIFSRIRELKTFSLRELLQTLFALNLSIDWQRRQAAALEVAKEILTSKGKLLHRKLLEEIKEAAERKYGVKPSDKDIIISVKWPRQKEKLQHILDSLSPDLESAINGVIVKWFHQKGLTLAFEKVKTTKKCPWCKQTIKMPLSYNFLIHLRWCDVVSKSIHILGFREYEINALLKGLR